MASKTPFEIRLDILKMAQDHVNQRYFESTITLDPKDPRPPFPTTQEIIAEAEQLKKFVDNQ